jgi:hypothetical protein
VLFARRHGRHRRRVQLERTPRDYPLGGDLHVLPAQGSGGEEAAEVGADDRYAMPSHGHASHFTILRSFTVIA